MGVLCTVPHDPVVLSDAVRQNLWIAIELWALMAVLLFAMLAPFWPFERLGDREATEAPPKRHLIRL